MSHNDKVRYIKSKGNEIGFPGKLYQLMDIPSQIITDKCKEFYELIINSRKMQSSKKENSNINSNAKIPE